MVTGLRFTEWSVTAERVSLKRHVPPRGQFIMKVDELLQVGKVQTITFFGLCVARGREETLRGSRTGRHTQKLAC